MQCCESVIDFFVILNFKFVYFSVELRRTHLSEEHQVSLDRLPHLDYDYTEVSLFLFENVTFNVKIRL